MNDELLKRLQDAGISVGQWAELPGVEQSLVSAESLLAIKAVLAQQMQQDMLALANAQEALERIKNGGGS